MVTTTANLEQPANHNLVTLAGTIKTDSEFATQPVANDQVVWPISSGINISSTLAVTGNPGTYVLWHIRSTDGVAVKTDYVISSGLIASDSVDIAAPTGYSVVTLAGNISTDAQFTVQPVAGDQIVYPNGTSVSATLGISAPPGNHTMWHIIASTGVVHKITYNVSGNFTTTANISAGASYTVATLATGFDTYVFQQWGVAPVAGDQIITLTADGYFDSNGDYRTEVEHIHDAWHINKTNGLCTHFTVDSTGVGGTTDTTPDPFNFTDLTDQPRSTVIESNAIVVTGVTDATNVAVTITGTGAEYAISTNGGQSFGAWTSSAGNIQRNHRIKLRLTSSASFSTPSTATLDIGGVTDVWSVTTQAVDTTPDSFTFTALTGVPLSTVLESNEITVAGVTEATNVTISVGNGEYAVNSGSGFGAWQTAPSVVQLGYIVKVRQTSSAGEGISKSTTLSIGGVVGTFTTTTANVGVDITPDSFTFNPLTDVTVSSIYESNTMTVQGVTAAAAVPLTITNGEYAVSTDAGSTFGAWTSSNGAVYLNNVIKVRHTSSSVGLTSYTTTLSLNGVSASFTTTTDIGPSSVVSGAVTINPYREIIVGGKRKKSPKVFTQDRTDRLNYGIDLTTWLNGDTITDVRVVEGATCATSGTFSTQEIMLWVQCGTATVGDATLITSRVTTALGAQLDISFYVVFIDY